MQKTKEQYIKRAKRIQKGANFLVKIYRVFNPPKNIVNDIVIQERHIETAAGAVRVYCYGFGDQRLLPLYFDLHGGGFILGAPGQDEKMNLEIVKTAGCRVVSIDYAKAPDHPFPQALNQVYAVVEYFYNNAAPFGIDKKRMAIGGHSAGGNLGAGVCMMAKAASSFNFVCHIADYPVMDLFTNPYEKPRPKGCIPPEIAIMFNACYVDNDKAKDPLASPVFASKEKLKGLPPALVILAGQDCLFNEGKLYADRLLEAGVPVRVKIYEKAKHGFTQKESPETKSALAEMSGFLLKHFA
jgi:acetyl esterase